MSVQQTTHVTHGLQALTSNIAHAIQPHGNG